MVGRSCVGMLNGSLHPEVYQSLNGSRLFDFVRRYWVVLIVGCVCVLVSIFAYLSFKDAAHLAQIETSEDHAAERNSDLVECFEMYEQALTFTRGFIQSSNYVDRDEWRRFIESAELESQYPGVWGFGYVEKVGAGEIESFVDEVRGQGLSDFSIKTHKGFERDDNDDLFVIKYEEPYSRNKSAIGLDVSSNPANRDVYDRATDLGIVQVSAPFMIKQQESLGTGIGIVMALPHYSPEMSIESVEDRRVAVIGWVTIVLDMDYFVEAMMWKHDNDRLAMMTEDFTGQWVTLFDTAESDPSYLCGSCGNNHVGISSSISFHVGGREFETRVVSDPAFTDTALSLGEFHDNMRKANIALYVGLRVTAVLVVLTLIVSYGRNRAVRLANGMTRSLRQSEELQRRFAEEALDANRAKTEFLANMSHEIRTPMTAVLGYTDILAEMVPEHTDPDAMHEAVDRIKRAGTHLLMVINDILDMSKIESGKLTITSGACRIGEILSDVVGTMKVRSNDQGLVLEAEFETEIPGTILADSYRMRQILLNLVGNAIKFTDRGGVRIVVGSDGDTLRFAVHDTGVGVQADQIERMFKPFEQDETNQNDANRGTGLGLSISRQLVDLMGGHLCATSVLGEGSVFTFDLPLKIPEQDSVEMISALPCTVPEESSRRRVTDIKLEGRVLLAEDGPDNQRLIKHVLGKAGLEVVGVWNGQEAVDLYQKNPGFDLIIMDMQMPVLDGYEATKKLRVIGCELPIMALTAHAMSGDRQRCLGCGCDEYESKPLNRARLLRTIERLLDPERSRGHRAA